MAEYNLQVLAEKYYKQYTMSDRMWSRRNDQGDLTAEFAFSDLPSSERDCIKLGLQAVILEIDPKAKFKIN